MLALGAVDLLGRPLVAMRGVRVTGWTVRTDLLRRARDTSTQTALTPEARQANVAGAFAAVTRPPARVVLVDDVFTTGATLCAAALALRAAGCEADRRHRSRGVDRRPVVMAGFILSVQQPFFIPSGH